MSDLSQRYRDAERALACCVLHHGTREVIESVKPGQVADPIARLIIAAAAALLDSGSEVDIITVALVRRDQDRDWPTKVQAVYACEGAVLTNWKTYAAHVAEGDFRRRAVALAERVIHAAEVQGIDCVADALAAAGAVTR